MWLFYVFRRFGQVGRLRNGGIWNGSVVTSGHWIAADQDVVLRGGGRRHVVVAGLRESGQARMLHSYRICMRYARIMCSTTPLWLGVSHLDAANDNCIEGRSGGTS